MSATLSTLSDTVAGRTGSRHDIDVWLTHYGRMDDELHLHRLRSLLTEDETIQEGRFYFADDRKRYLVTRAMVRTVLSRYVPIEPELWTFSKNAYGRPMIGEDIANAQVLARDLSFNVSHTRGLIALAVTRGREIGVDVENLTTRQVSLDIANAYFCRTEVADLFDTPSALQQDRFFEYWTFKESYIKARGMGLSLPLDRFRFQFPQDDEVRIHIDSDLNDHAERWSFWQYRPAPGYLMAVCAERRAEVSPQVSIREFMPLAGETLLVTKPLRRSGPG